MRLIIPGRKGPNGSDKRAGNTIATMRKTLLSGIMDYGNVVSLRDLIQPCSFNIEVHISGKRG